MSKRKVQPGKESQVEILSTISKTHRSQFDQRRQYEWRVLLSTLGIYGVSVAAKLTGDLILPNSRIYICFLIMVWFGFLLLASLASIYLSHIHKANRINKQFAQAAEDELMKLSGTDAFTDIKRQILNGEGSNWSLNWQVGALFLFAVVSALVITMF